MPVEPAVGLRPSCLKALREGDTLVVWKLDRLGRSLHHLVTTVHGLTARGVGLKVLTACLTHRATAPRRGEASGRGEGTVTVVESGDQGWVELPDAIGIVPQQRADAEPLVR